MKIIAIGDVHGRTLWEKVVQQDFDKVVFIGDYFDSFDILTYQQIENFKNIIKFKKDNPGKVVLLLGNHDYHYLPGVKEHYSGYQGHMALDIQEVLRENMDHLKICHIEGEYLFVHAGITKTWYKNIVEQDNLFGIPELYSLEEQINNLFIFKPNYFGFSPGNYHDPYGNETCQSPIWVRPESLVRDKIEGYVQVVGHTTQLDGIKQDKGIILIDTLIFDRPQYLVIEDNKALGTTMSPRAVEL